MVVGNFLLVFASYLVAYYHRDGFITTILSCTTHGDGICTYI